MAREGLLYGLRTALHEAPQREAGRSARTGCASSTTGSSATSTSRSSRWRPPADGAHFLVLFEDADPPARADRRRPRPRRPRRQGGRKARARRGGERHGAAQARGRPRRAASRRSWPPAASTSSRSSRTWRPPTRSCSRPTRRSSPANEELQSTNEELDTAKEELQSTNEELNTRQRGAARPQRGAEPRQQRPGQPAGAACRSRSSWWPRDLRIRRFTPMAEQVLNLIPTDVGRPIGDIKPNIDVPGPGAADRRGDRHGDASRSARSGTADGHRYLLRVRPYKNVENRIDGAVLALFDIEDARRHHLDAQAADRQGDGRGGAARLRRGGDRDRPRAAAGARRRPDGPQGQPRVPRARSTSRGEEPRASTGRPARRVTSTRPRSASCWSTC